MAGDILDTGVGVVGGIVTDLTKWGKKPEIKPEEIVRPYESWKERYDQRIAELRAPPGLEEEDPELCIGGEGDTGFIDGAKSDLPGGGGFNTKEDDEEEEEEEKEKLVWTEQSRKTKKIRVENPDDSDQYVMVERIEQMDMRAPSQPPFNGETHTWVFRNR